ncbi:hypothetical protein WHZ76_14070 [Citrobacter portucalensis]|uniref:hypothetical protein n=1 Tax=Citrobacter portucalensis TaxID=1639133 RepID=UPI00339D055A
MADITFAMERDSSHKAAKNKLDVRSKAKQSEEHKSQSACDCRSLVFRRYRRGYCFGIISNGAGRGVSVLIV